MKPEIVREYYGDVLSSSADLKTDACATLTQIPAHIRAALANIHDEVAGRYYGCGLVIPEHLDGLSVLDLGCGAGRDCYVLAQLVGAAGHVTGLDMTPEQLAVARAHEDWHRARFGYARSNVSFVDGEIHRLGETALEPESFDVIVSNCVFNLTPDKGQVLADAWRLLKPGGELYFADVYADRRLPAAFQDDPVLVGECLGGALYWNDFLTLARKAGFADPRLVEDRPLAIHDAAIRQAVGAARFYSATYRLFKLEGLEEACEDYGQAVVYRGTLATSPHRFTLDAHHVMETGKAFPVCGNTWRMLMETRFAPYFDFHGSFATHYGIFKGCGTDLPFHEDAVAQAFTETSGCC